MMNTISRLFALTMAACPCIAFAQTSVTFHGKVVAETCQPTVSGAAAGTVTLPTVAVTSLVNTGAKTGLTPFTIILTGCTPPVAGNGEQVIHVVFRGRKLTLGNNLGNMGDARNVSVQITTDDTGTVPADMTGTIGTPGLVLREGAESTSHTYAAQYITEEGSAGPGLVKAGADYVLEYL